MGMGQQYPLWATPICAKAARGVEAGQKEPLGLWDLVSPLGQCSVKLQCQKLTKGC